MADEAQQAWQQTLESLRAPLYRRDEVTTSARVVLGQLLELEADGEAASASQLGAAFAAHLQETATTLRPNQHKRWALLQTLADADLALPVELRRQIAVSVLDDRPTAAALAATRLRQRDPAEARRVAQGLRRHAPELARALEDHLDPRQLAEPPSPVRLWTRVLIAVSLALGAFLLWVNVFPSAGPTGPRYSAAQARRAAVRGTLYARSIKREDLSLSALAIVDLLDEQNCHKAQLEAALLRSQLATVDPWRGPPSRPLYEVIEIADGLCPSPGDGLRGVPALAASGPTR